MSRRLAALLALFLVPVVVLTHPNVAQAVETVVRGEAVTATVDGFALMPLPDNDLSCAVSAQWLTPTSGSIFSSPVVEVGGVSCFAGFAFDNLGGGPGSSMQVELSGGSCGGSVDMPISYDSGFEARRLFFPGPATASIDATCSIDTVCLTYHSEGSGPFGWYANDHGPACTAFPLGLPPEPPGQDLNGCKYLQNINVVLRLQEFGTVGGSWGFSVEVDGDLTPAGQAFGTGSTFVTAHLVWTDYGAVGPPYRIGVPGGGTVINFQKESSTDDFFSFYQTVPASGWADLNQVKFHGIQIQIRPVATVDTYENGNFTGTPPMTDPASDLGMTKPDACMFYYGDKIAETPDELDQPAGPTPVSCSAPADAGLITTHPCGGNVGQPVAPGSAEPVTPPEPPAEDPADAVCGDFSFFSPSTWVDSGFCHVIAALKGVWEAVLAVGSAVAKLPGRIADAVGALFVPADGFVSTKVDSVKDRWSDTAPVVLADEVTGLGDAFQMAPPAGCAGPELAFSNPVGGGAVSLRPLSACGEYVSVLANLIKIALTVVVYVGAGLAAVRIVGSAFGVDLSIDKNGE